MSRLNYTDNKIKPSSTYHSWKKKKNILKKEKNILKKEKKCEKQKSLINSTKLILTKEKLAFHKKALSKMKKPAKFKIFRLKNEVDFTFERFSYKRLRRRSCRWLYTDKINKYDNKLFKSSLDNFLLMGISFLRKKMYFIQKFRKLIKGKQESYNSRKYLIWIKKKKKKRLRHKHNFSFFFSKKRRISPRLSLKWLRFQRKKKKKSYLTLFDIISNTLSYFFKLRYTKRLKKTLKKKLALKYKFKIYYKIFTETKFRALKKKVVKKKKKLFSLFFFLESRLSSVCIRFHFFWSLRKAFFWISKGTISVNGLIAAYGNFKAKLNDIIAVIGPIPLWKKYLMRRWVVKKHHIKFHKSLNYSEFNYGCSSGIILKLPFKIKEIKFMLKKRRKTWIKFNTFLYLTHNFI